MDKLYDIVEELKVATKTIVQSGERNGIPQYKGGKDVPWGTAIVYALNNKAELHAFLHCGDMECSNNRAERMLRPVCHTKMEFLSTKSSFMAFAVIMTIFMTCKANKINPYEYIHWIFANVKIRREDYRLEISKITGTTAQLLKLPRPYKKDGKTINLFDKEYDCWADKLDWTGLDIWSYSACYDAERSRIRPEYRVQPSEVAEKEQPEP